MRVVAPVSNQVLGYIRVSTHEQKLTGVSPEVQRALLGDYCKLRGLELVEIISDLGISAGKELKKRPGGKQLLDRVAEGAVKGVVVMKLDRLFRNAKDCLNVVEDWDKADVALHLVSQGGSSIDTTSAIGRFLLIIMAGVAEMERNLTRERVQEVVAYKQERGERTGTIPYGQRTVMGGKKLEPHPEEQRVIEYIRSLRDDKGNSLERIVAELNEQGIPARGSQWHKTTVARLLARTAVEETHELE